MDWRSIVSSNFTLARLIEVSINVIFIAIVFEFLAWWLGRRIEAWVTPLIPNDAGRERSWAVKRRTTLRQTPKLIARTTCYVSALLLVLNAFNVPILPLSIALGAVALLFGAALMPLLRDAAQGYALLADDLAAPGDVVEVAGKRGVVEKLSLRGLWLRDDEKRLHFFANRGVHDVSVISRRQEAPTAPAFDPLTTPPKTPQPGASGGAPRRDVKG